jgi:hypothetical protein
MRIAHNGSKFYLTEAAHVVAVGQLKEKIPTLWTLVKKDITTMTRSEANILAALARLGENHAAELLCQYYQLERKKPDPTGLVRGYSVTTATALAFALHPVTLNCLLMDFQQIDLDEKEQGSDYYWCPAHFLGEQISLMLKNYPYKKNLNFDRYQLKDWLKTNPDLEVSGK